MESAVPSARVRPNHSLQADVPDGTRPELKRSVASEFRSNRRQFDLEF
jgi:hypothetical protein